LHVFFYAIEGDDIVKYEEITIEVIEFTNEDVIVTSITETQSDIRTPEIPI